VPECPLAGIDHCHLRICLVACLDGLEVTFRPPGCTIARILSLRPTSTPSRKGKKASETIVAPIRPPLLRFVASSISLKAVESLFLLGCFQFECLVRYTNFLKQRASAIFRVGFKDGNLRYANRGPVRPYLCRRLLHL